VGQGLLLALPLGSLLLRLAVALGVALLLVRLLDVIGLRSPRARVVAAVSPFVVTAAVGIISSGDPALPSLLQPTSGTGTLAIPLDDRYLGFAPRAVPWLLLLWPVATATLLARRTVRARRRRAVLVATARPVDPRTAAVVARLARALEVPPPRTLVAAVVPGGAALLGVRDPLLVLDERLLAVLDEGELEGVLAHELAHVARRDNLVAWLAAAVGDLVCFLPGASGAMRRLRREREAAADQRAVEVTERPAALASGLLRALDLAAPGRRLPAGCAALVEPGGVVGRVRLLVESAPPSSRRHRREVALAAAASLLAVAAAVLLPAALRGEDGRREAVAVLLGEAADTTTGVPAAPSAAEGRAFEVYRRGAAGAVAPDAPAVRAVRGDLLSLDRVGVAATCAATPAVCRGVVRTPTLTLRPDPIQLLAAPTVRWQATPVLTADPGERIALYWLSRLDGAAAPARP
jgi:Zn-dependent protease with chaperone function